MSNSSKEYWFINGTSLNTYAWSVSTFAVGRQLPLMRGTNIQVAYIPGQIWRKKYPDSRTITLTMWLAAINPATDQPNQNDLKLQFNDNLRTLQQLFYNVGGNQFPLTRQWRFTLPVNAGVPSGVPTMVQATAMAEVAGNMTVAMQGPHSGAFSIDLLLADPYFYGTPVQELIAYNTITNVINTGDDVAAYSNNLVTLSGPLQYPRLTNTTTTPNTWFQLNTVIQAGDSITFDVANFNATRSSDGANLSGSITHSGTKRWMSYNPGSNSLILTSANAGDTGTAQVSFVPPYV